MYDYEGLTKLRSTCKHTLYPRHSASALCSSRVWAPHCTTPNPRNLTAALAPTITQAESDSSILQFVLLLLTPWRAVFPECQFFQNCQCSRSPLLSVTSRDCYTNNTFVIVHLKWSTKKSHAFLHLYRVLCHQAKSREGFLNLFVHDFRGPLDLTCLPSPRHTMEGTVSTNETDWSMEGHCLHQWDRLIHGRPPSPPMRLTDPWNATVSTNETDWSMEVRQFKCEQRLGPQASFKTFVLCCVHPDQLLFYKIMCYLSKLNWHKISQMFKSSTLTVVNLLDILYIVKRGFVGSNSNICF